MGISKLLLLALAACEDGGGGGGGDGGGDDSAMFALVQADLEEYRDWEQATGLDGIIDDTSDAHGRFVSIWYNDIGLGSLVGQDDGAAAVMEEYLTNDDSVLVGIVAMRFGEEAWFYADVDQEGEVDDFGRDDGCIRCHEANGNNGFLGHTTL